MELSFTQKIIYRVPSALPKELLDIMERQFDELEFSNAEVGSVLRLDKGVRDSDVHFIPWDQWIPAMLWSVIHSANVDYFHYDLTYWESGLQATRYRGEDKQFYNWHYDELHNIERHRKLSCSLLLNDEYEGGELQFHHNQWTQSIKPKRGEIVIFPSWLPHRVRRITSGTRKSLVGWAYGPPFK